MDILRTHPMAIAGGILHANPYFAQPIEFLHEVAGRNEAAWMPYRS